MSLHVDQQMVVRLLLIHGHKHWVQHELITDVMYVHAATLAKHESRLSILM